jgi:predicted protein tyrosine phosphatase
MSVWENRNGVVGTAPVAGFDDFPGHKIALSFDDAVLEGQGIFVAELADVERFLKWAETVPYPATGTILFHCHAGISRSTAIALTFLTLKHGPGSESKCMADVARARPKADPNDLIVDLADQALGRDGSLLKAMREWKDSVKTASMY